MSRNRPDSEAALEAATMRLFAELGYETLNAEHEICGVDSPLGRSHRGEIVLGKYLAPAIESLNPDLPPIALEQVQAALMEDRRLMTPAAANREVYQLLRNGVKVRFRDERGHEVVETAHVIDWDIPANNHFLAVQQLWLTGDTYTIRPDIVCFVNGLPLVLIELKAHYRTLNEAYLKNLRDYKAAFLPLFWYNGLVILSNGSDSRLGSMTADYSHFNQWKRVSDEGESREISLERMLRGVCEPSRLLDIIENFTLFDEAKGRLEKVVSKNHQFLGVNRAVHAVQDIRHNQGRLGVFWHTQGSGKSYSMVFFTQKVFRKLPGNWTFVVITDRDDLDTQIYKNFANVGVVTEPVEQVRAQSGAHLRELLRQDHRYVFTLIQKFHTRNGELYPVLSERDDIIVITDEAHRTQYDTLALNMRRALPNAAFIGFTGTPLIAGEEKTREVFGDYISIYDFKQSVEDGATLPLWYENRVPELHLENPSLNAEFEALLEEAALDETQEEAVKQHFAQEYHLITRDDRLERVAEDIARHYSVRGFQGRGYGSKAMVVSIDKMTAVRMYDKVRKYWAICLDELRAEFMQATDEERRQELREHIAFMDSTDMAVVVSPGQGEAGQFAAKGLDIATHRQRMKREDLETKFKDDTDPFRIVFVCAMWMTGFDAKSCDTMYLDKPMRNHTLMQTIARANRVFKTKVNGLVVDYMGVFRNLQQALAIYASGGTGGEMPAQDKGVLVEALRGLLADFQAFLAGLGVELEALDTADAFDRIRRMDEAVNAINVNETTREHFTELAQEIRRTFHSLLPDTRASEFEKTVNAIERLYQKVQETADPTFDVAEVDGLTGQVEELLDRSVKVGAYKLPHLDKRRLIDLTEVDFDILRERFEQGYQNTEAVMLQTAVRHEISLLIRLNPARLDFQEKYQAMIEAWNDGSKDVEELFDDLIVFTQALIAEAHRAEHEGLSEAELAVFDILAAPRDDFSDPELVALKQTIGELLVELQGKLVLDWRKQERTRAQVRTTIETKLDTTLPTWISKEVFDEKCAAVYQHVYDSYQGEGRSVYTD